MAEGDAEKKNISRLDFNISDAINSLDLVDKKLKNIAESSSKYGTTISKNLSKGLNTSNLVDTNNIEKNLNKVTNLSKTKTEALNAQLIKIESKKQAAIEVEAIKGEQARQTAAYKSMLKQEEYNDRILKSTESLYDKITQYAKTYVIYQGFNALKKAISETIDEMVKVEQQMVAIDRVMNVSGMNIDDFRDKLIQLAYDYGNSFDNVADVSLRLAQAGIKENNNLKLTEKTLLALNTAELDAKQATDDMVAVMSQWNLITEDATKTAKEYGDIIDKVNKVADNFPTTSADILDALKKTSSAFNLAGASIDETIATIVAAEKASQRGGKVIGTALSNITQQLKDTKKVDLAESLGISFFADEAKTQYKPVMEIFEALSEKMEQLKKEGKESSVEMQQLLNVFTVFRRNIGASLLGEMAGEESTYAKVLQTTSEAIGYSMDENAKYMQTAKAAQEQFNAELLKLKTEIWDGNVENTYKDLLNSGADIINWIKNLSKDMKLLPAIIGLVTAAFSLLGKKMDANALKKYTASIKEMRIALQLYNDTVNKGEMTTREFNDIMGKDIPKSVKSYTTSLNGAKASMSGLIVNTVLQTAKQIALNVAIAAGEAAISFGLSLAIQAIVTLIGNWIHATENAAKSINEMNNEINDGKNELDSYVDKFQDLRKELESGKLTQEEFNKKKAELKDLETELIKKYGDEAKGINLVTGEIKEQTKAIEDLNKVDYKKYIQENEKQINELNKSLNENIMLKLPEMYKTRFGTHSDLYDGLYKYLNENFMEMSEKQVGDATFFNTADYGKPEEVLEHYRAMYDGLKKYREETYDTLSDKDKQYLDTFIENVSNTIKSTNEKYSEAITEYEKLLNNRLKYDEHYSEVYAKILQARAKVSEASLQGNSKELEKATEELNKVYKEALNQASSDPQLSEGMTKLIEKQIEDVNEEIEREQLGLKIGVQGDALFDSIQSILREMGDITSNDLKSAFDVGEITPKMQELKDLLDENGISLEDFTDNLEYLGLTIGDTNIKLTETTDNLKLLSENVDSSIEGLVNLDAGFTTVYNAMDEFNKNGYISASTLQNLINNDLLQFLEVTSDELAINEAAMVNAATAAKAKAIEDLQAKAAAEIAAIAFSEESNAASAASGTTASMTEKTNNVKNALMQMTPEALKAADAWEKLTAAMGANVEGLADDQISKINSIMSNLSKSITAVNSVKIESVSYRRASASSSGSRGGSSSSSSSSTAAAEAAAAREAQRAAEAAAKAEEDEYKKRLEAFKKYISEKERLEKRWVDKQKDLGLLTTSDFLFITQERITRYKQYLEEVNKATWIKEEDRLELQKEYSEKVEDLQVEYFKYLKDKLNEEIDSLKKANEEKIDLIKEEADKRIEALRKVEKENDRIRAKEEYEKRRQEHLDDISYWEQRTGREAQQALKEAKKNLKELDEEWENQKEDWSIEDQIKAIEDERDTQIKAIQDAQEAEIKAMQDVYDAKVKLFAETGKIIYEGNIIQSQALYQQYKKNFIDPIKKELADLNNSLTKKSAPEPTPAPAQTQEQQYESYTVKRGDSLWGIAQSVYGDGSKWTKIYDANQSIIGGNPSLIYAGQTYKIPKFHQGGIVGGNKEGYALLKPDEVILKPEWADGINKLAQMAKNRENPINTTNTVIEVSGDLVRIDANIKDRTDAEYLTKRVEKMLKDKFNIKK